MQRQWLCGTVYKVVRMNEFTDTYMYLQMEKS